ncbi:MAG: 5-deoxy-glucuronate isomerase [Vicinamibacteria bacterium]|jgi:5-deoxy-glucuronate isomerase|nr:5-deoxy-glucuronate isomerase [Vicinamibacteria bacterium]
MSTATAETTLTLESCVVRDTASKKGRTRTVSPDKTSAKHLHYGRIILDAGDAPLSIETGGHETGFIVLGGSASIVAGGKTFEMGRYDALYTPRDGVVEVRPGSGGCDIAEISAPVDHAYPLQFVPFAEVQKDPGLHFKAGGASAERTLNVLFGKNIQAGRIMAGVTFSAPGNWTSWPPHEHAALAEEAYLYIDMPAPSFGLQMVYTDKTTPELAVVVREGDVVLMPKGYHPNVAAPGGSINFLWMMAANRETEDRLFGVVNVHPDFRQTGSGLDAGKAK